MKPGIYVRGHGVHSHKNTLEIGPEVAPKDDKTCFEPIQCGLLATHPAPILNAFEIIDVNQCAHAYTGKKFPYFCTGNFTDPKTS